MDEAHLGPDHIFEAIQRYAADRAERHRRLRAVVDAIDAGGVGRRCRSCAPTHTSTSDRAGRRTCRGARSRHRERRSPPDLRYLIYVGIALAAVLAALFTPYLIAYLLQAMNGG